jgi:hypothetical protein
MADDGRRKPKWIPGLAIAAVIVVGIVGLVRGCGYAVEDTNYENSSQGTRSDPAA